MSTPPRDWDKELAAIDRAIERSAPPAGTPAAPSPGRPGGAPAMGAAPAAALPAAASSASPKPALPAHVAGPRATTTTWLRVVLAAVLAAAVPFWPYGRACGAGLFLYLGVTGMVVLAGGWSAVSAWHRRRPRAHLVALLVTLWGVGLVAHEILPRIGYARAVAHWTCG